MNSNGYFAELGSLTLGKVVADIPHDLPALIVYLMVAALALFVWWGSSPRSLARYGPPVPIGDGEPEARPQPGGAQDEPAAAADVRSKPPQSVRRPAPRRKSRGADRITWLG
jgi:hypothetical protein